MAADPAHPFLICRAADLPELRRRAEREPWRSMREDALRRVAAGVDRGDSRAGVHRYLGACALAHILAEAGEGAAHAHRIRDAIREELPAIPFGFHHPAVSNPWIGTVPPLGAVFVAVIALDIVHPALAPADVEACEGVIAERLSRIERDGPWPLARLGAFGTWDVYRGARTEPDDAYHETYLRQMTPDGVTRVATNYAFARLGSGDDRPQKTGYADVLEHTGIDRRYYGEPRLGRFYRWLCGSAVTPARELHPFGDVLVQGRPPLGMLLYRIDRFDREAAAHAAWLTEGRGPPGHVLPYVLMRAPLPEPRVPSSALFPDGGAFLREARDDPRALGAALYNITAEPEFHTHEETNAVSLAARGARLLVNGGWLGETTRPASMNNTLELAGRGHGARVGAGLAEGLLGPGLDYAAGDGGDVLGAGARFTRSLVGVYPEASAGGYFVVGDEIEGAEPEEIRLNWQMAAESPAAEGNAGGVYEARIDHHARVAGVGVRIALAPAPDAVEQELVPSGELERNPSAGHHVRLAARFAPGAASAEPGRGSVRRLLTVFSPFDGEQPPAELAPVELERGAAERGASALRVHHASGVSDLVAAGADDGDTAIADTAFRGALVVRRRGEGGFLFARRMSRFDDGELGLQAEAPISLYLGAGEGAYTCPAPTRLTLRRDGLAALLVDGEALAPIEAGPGRLAVRLPAGRHRLDVG